MPKPKLIFLLAFVLISCNNNAGIIIGEYLFPFPKDYYLKREQGTDSDIGKIESKKLTLYFDYGYYTNHLVESPGEYVDKGEWKWEAFRNIIKREGAIDEKMVKKIVLLGIRKIKPQRDSIEFPDADIIASCQFDSIKFDYGISFPSEAKMYDFLIDTIQGHYRKIIVAKDPAKGKTGIYLKDIYSFNSSINSYLALGMATSGLSKQQQDSLISVFRRVTIVKAN